MLPGATPFYTSKVSVSFVEPGRFPKPNSLLWTIVNTVRIWLKNKARYAGAVPMINADASGGITDLWDYGVWSRLMVYGNVLRYQTGNTKVIVTARSLQDEDGNVAQWACRIVEQPIGIDKQDIGLERGGPSMTVIPRTWYTEFGFTLHPDTGEEARHRTVNPLLTISVSYLDRPGFLGVTEPVPTPNVPRPVRYLASNRNLNVTVSGMPVRYMKAIVTAGGAGTANREPGAPQDGRQADESDMILTADLAPKEFWELACDPKRSFPIVALDNDSQTGRPIADIDSLAELLFPNAMVVTARDADSLGLLSGCAPDDSFAFPEHGLRVFFPFPAMADDAETLRREATRHPVLSETQICSYRDLHGYDGEPDLTDPALLLLRRTLARAINPLESDVWLTTDSLKAKQERLRLRDEIRRSQDELSQARERFHQTQHDIAAQRDRLQQELDEQTELLELMQHAPSEEPDKTEKDTDQLKARIKELTQQRDDAQQLAEYGEEAENRLEQANLKIHELEQDNDRLEQDRDNLRIQLDQIRMDAAYQNDSDQSGTVDTTGLVRAMSGNRRSYTAIVEFFQRKYADRIEILDRAWKSLDECRAMPMLLWQSMELLCTTAYQCYDGTYAGGNPENTFTDHNTVNAAITLASSEGAKTKEDNKLIGKRRMTAPDGSTYVMLKHLKSGGNERRDNFIRVYYEWDANKRRLVVGSIGPHLENYQTGKVR